MTERKFEKECKMSFSIFISIYTLHLAYRCTQDLKTLALIGAETSVTEICIGEKENEQIKGLINNCACSFVKQYNLSLSRFVPNFRILNQVVDEKSLTEKHVNMYYIGVTEGKMKI